jgi:hypothetical protein
MIYGYIFAEERSVRLVLTNKSMVIVKRNFLDKERDWVSLFITNSAQNMREE